MRAQQPIGIFDSGIGGLTIAKAISQQLPNEQLIYFGDTAHMPWGNQSASAIGYYTQHICHLLQKHNCKAFVIACNSASATALSVAHQTLGQQALLIDAINPVIEHIYQTYHNLDVGLIGTYQTIASKSYTSALHQLNSTIRVHDLATPLLAPLIEEGFIEHPVMEAVLKHYCDHPSLQNIQAIILGCTHYPLLHKSIKRFLSRKVTIIDSPALIANKVASLLKQRCLISTEKNSDNIFFISSKSRSFTQMAQELFGAPITLTVHPLWDYSSFSPMPSREEPVF